MTEKDIQDTSQVDPRESEALAKGYPPVGRHKAKLHELPAIWFNNVPPELLPPIEKFISDYHDHCEVKTTPSPIITKIEDQVIFEIDAFTISKQLQGVIIHARKNRETLGVDIIIGSPESLNPEVVNESFFRLMGIIDNCPDTILTDHNNLFSLVRKNFTNKHDYISPSVNIPKTEWIIRNLSNAFKGK